MTICKVLGAKGVKMAEPKDFLIKFDPKGPQSKQQQISVLNVMAQALSQAKGQ